LPTSDVSEPEYRAGEYVTYTVKSGDVLGQIALDHDVAVEDLMYINNITDQDQIQAGQELLIPVKVDAED
jgi:membrane-bound lytic murein transglycosylase D